jgi:hypothetical protein
MITLPPEPPGTQMSSGQEDDMAEVHIQLFGGEQDGYRANIDLRSKAPEMFYIWRAIDNEAITLASGKKRMVLATKLAVLAYRLDEETKADDDSARIQLRYVRHATADKKLSDPAM